MPKTAKISPAQTALDQGLEFQAGKNFDAAMECFENAVMLDPGFAPAYAAAANLFMAGEMYLQALDCYACAIQSDTNTLSYKDGFISALQHLDLKIINDQITNIVLDCLNTDQTDVYFMGNAWKNILMISPGFKDIQALLKREDYEEFCKILKKSRNSDWRTAPLFLKGLERLRVPDLRFEKFLVNLRHFLLDNVLSPHEDLDQSDLLQISKSLAHYCFATDYVFPVSDAERAALDDIDTSTSAGLAVYACYKPLALLNKDIKATALADIIKTQITDVLEQREIVQTLPAISDISPGVSEKVRAQYETQPYPRWNSFSKTIYNEEIEGVLRNKNAKILNAGCGTGHEAAELATVFPDAEILAVDLSKTSLGYAIQKTREHGLNTITFKHGDILQLETLNEPFDFITASGVLHHMDDPLKGWKILSGLLKPGGLMRIALYSRIARKPIAEARKVIAEQGYTQDPQSVRAFRYDCKNLLSKHTFEKITASQEFYNLSECVDLLFHAQEHQLTLPEIDTWLKELGLEFIAFQVADKVTDIYREAFPDDPAATNLQNWARFEEEKHPELFTAMYRFWCRKK